VSRELMDNRNPVPGPATFALSDFRAERLGGRAAAGVSTGGRVNGITAGQLLISLCLTTEIAVRRGAQPRRLTAGSRAATMKARQLATFPRPAPSHCGLSREWDVSGPGRRSSVRGVRAHGTTLVRLARAYPRRPETCAEEN
jgi:hypothetical protein